MGRSIQDSLYLGRRKGRGRTYRLTNVMRDTGRTTASMAEGGMRTSQMDSNMRGSSAETSPMAGASLPVGTMNTREIFIRGGEREREGRSVSGSRINRTRWVGMSTLEDSKQISSMAVVPSSQRKPATPTRETSYPGSLPVLSSLSSLPQRIPHIHQQ